MNESLRSYGWSRHFEARFAALSREDLLPGRVVQTQRGHLKLHTTNGLTDAKLAGRVRREGDSGTVPAVGDWVAFRQRPGETAVVETVLERQTQLSRKVSGERVVEQLVAANVDLVLLVMGLDGDYNLRRLERFLIMVEESGARAAVVLNKADVCDELEERLGEVRGACAGRPVVTASALEGDVGAVEVLLEPRETVALLGSSGVGKSTLINRLRADESLRTQEVREHDSRGRHTTTHRELFRLDNGTLVIDNPGIRELQLWQADDGLSSVFDDIEALAGECRFSDCRHEGEPGCAVRAAIDRGEVDAVRLESRRRLEAEAESLERRKDTHAQRKHEKNRQKFYRKVLSEKKNRRR